MKSIMLSESNIDPTFSPFNFLAKATMGMKISQSYLELHLLFFLVLLHRSFLLIMSKFSFFNSQFRRLSLRGFQGARASTNTPRKGRGKTSRTLSLFWGNLASLLEVVYFDSLGCLCKWISSEDRYDSVEDIEEEA